ncbi:hypothetical protein KCP75_16590 [Salmonella enterica subsp. enterica]|nr:hypothetical protein KCP75_16590 [Salmonella enterica subsp. enterica]
MRGVVTKALSVWIKAVYFWVCGSLSAGAVIFGTREELMAEAKASQSSRAVNITIRARR